MYNRNLKIGAAVTAALAIPTAALLATPQSALATPETYVFLTDTHIGAGASAETDTASAFTYAKNYAASYEKKTKKKTSLAAVVNCGDITDAGGEAQYRKYLELWKKSGLSVPRIQVMGNHDNATGGYETWLRTYKLYGYDGMTGVNHFKKILNGGKLNTVTQLGKADIITIGGGVKNKVKGVFTPAMVKELNSQLQTATRKGKMAIVVCHYAPWHGTDDQCSKIPEYFDEILGVCHSYPNVIYVCGHEHVFENEKHFKDQVESKHYYSYTTPGNKMTENSIVRDGFKKGTTYPINLLCLNSISRIHGFHGGNADSKRSSFVYAVTIDDAGTVTFETYNQTKKKTSSETFKKTTGSVSVGVSLPKASKAKSVSVKVVFSDGGTYGGVKSGSTISVGRDKKKTISGIPSGVLVTATPTTGVSGCKTPAAKKAEVSTAGKTVTFTYSK